MACFQLSHFAVCTSEHNRHDEQITTHRVNSHNSNVRTFIEYEDNIKGLFAAGQFQSMQVQSITDSVANIIIKTKYGNATYNEYMKVEIV